MRGADDTPLSFMVARMRADRYEFQTRLAPAQGDPAAPAVWNIATPP